MHVYIRHHALVARCGVLECLRALLHCALLDCAARRRCLTSTELDKRARWYQHDDCNIYIYISPQNNLII